MTATSQSEGSGISSKDRDMVAAHVHAGIYTIGLDRT